MANPPLIDPRQDRHAVSATKREIIDGSAGPARRRSRSSPDDAGAECAEQALNIAISANAFDERSEAVSAICSSWTNCNAMQCRDALTLVADQGSAIPIGEIEAIPMDLFSMISNRYMTEITSAAAVPKGRGRHYRLDPTPSASNAETRVDNWPDVRRCAFFRTCQRR
jgi:hypothetical protein